jgi:enamine deaminase RidA (YjgF/YER057c/UK114 family)
MVSESEDPIEARLRQIGLVLPPARPAGATYSPYSISNNQLFISGQVSAFGDKSVLGRVGDELDVEAAIGAARLCALNILAQIRDALGGFERLRSTIKINGYVQVAGTFDEIPKVVDGCSAVLLAALGDRGGHARTSVGVARLPRNHAVEIDALVDFTL